MAPQGDTEFIVRRPIRPKSWEFKISPDSFIYCTNTECEAFGTGLGRVHIGPAQPLRCTYCECRFPTKPNGGKWGYDHFAALVKGKRSPPTPAARPKAGGGKQNNGSSSGGRRMEAIDYDLLASKIRDGLQPGQSSDRLHGRNNEGRRNGDSPGNFAPARETKPSVVANSQRIPAWGNGPKNDGGANSPPVSIGDPEKPADPLDLFDLSACSNEQKQFLASLKPKAEPAVAAAGSPPPNGGRPKATVIIQPSSDSYGKAVKAVDLAKKDRDNARKRLQDAVAEFQEAETEMEISDKAVADAEAARQAAWDDFQKVSSTIGVKAATMVQSESATASESFSKLSTFCGAFGKLNPVAAEICDRMSNQINEFQSMLDNIEKAKAAELASASVPVAEAGGNPQTEAQVSQASGGTSVKLADISSENEDADISNLSDYDAQDGSGTKSADIKAAAAILSSGNGGGNDSDERNRVIKAQCSDTRARVNTLREKGTIGKSSG